MGSGSHHEQDTPVDMPVPSGAGIVVSLSVSRAVGSGAREYIRRMPGDPDLATTAPVEDASWFLCWGLRGDGSCQCRAAERCDRPGKHPWSPGFPHGHRDAVPWAALPWPQGVAGAPGVRLARATGTGAQGAVLDADGLDGVADLLRVWLLLPWDGGVVGVAATPRGVHVHLSVAATRGWPGGAGQRRLRERGLRHLEFKSRGQYVVWPEPVGTTGYLGLRRWLTREETRDWWLRMERVWAGGLDWVRAWDRSRMAGQNGAAGEAGEAGEAEAGEPWPWEMDWAGLEEPVDMGSGGLDSEGGNREADAVELGERLLRACWAVARADAGARNNLLNWAGFVAGRPALAGGLDRAWVVAELTAAGREAGLEPGEVERTVRSGLGLGLGLGTAL